MRSISKFPQLAYRRHSLESEWKGFEELDVFKHKCGTRMEILNSKKYLSDNTKNFSKGITKLLNACKNSIFSKRKNQVDDVFVWVKSTKIYFQMETCKSVEWIIWIKNVLSTGGEQNITTQKHSPVQDFQRRLTCLLVLWDRKFELNAGHSIMFIQLCFSIGVNLCKYVYLTLNDVSVIKQLLLYVYPNTGLLLCPFTHWV